MKALWAPWRMEYIQDAKENQTQECIFCTKPKQKQNQQNLIVYESEHCFVMLNKFPYNNGHLMVIPYIHESDPTALTDSVFLDIQHTLNKTILAVRQTMEPHGLNIGMNLGRTAGAGIEDHLHWHLVPRWNGDTNFMPVIADTKVISEALDQTWQKLVAAYKEIS
jgi:ATP adenylyltransferase